MRVVVLAACELSQLIATAEQEHFLRQTQLCCIGVRGLCWKSLAARCVLRATSTVLRAYTAMSDVRNSKLRNFGLKQVRK
jgi:hypothetical protein